MLFFFFLLRTPLVTGLAALKCHQKQRFKKVLGGWEKSKFLEERAAWAGASSQDALSSLGVYVESGQGNAGDKASVALSSIRVSAVEGTPGKALKDRGRLAGEHGGGLPACLASSTEAAAVGAPPLRSGVQGAGPLVAMGEGAC